MQKIQGYALDPLPDGSGRSNVRPDMCCAYNLLLSVQKQKSVVPVLPNCAKAPGSVDKNEKGTIVKYKKTASFDAVFGTP